MKEKILTLLANQPQLSSSQIYEQIEDKGSYTTLRRELSALLKTGLIVVQGRGKASRYSLSPTYHLFAPTSLENYFRKEIDERNILKGYNFDLMDLLQQTSSLFTEEELSYLNKLQAEFTHNISTLSPSLYRLEMERLGIDLSWKSSQIEGNTYSLLETERLLKDKETAQGKTKDEAIMLLNHKDALDFILDNPDYLDTLSVVKLEEVHSILTKDLDVDRNIRKRRVGITGTNYQPLDNEFQIREALEATCQLVSQRACVFEKALLVLLLISYIQPFNDGNKRTARIVSNAILIAYRYCPLSFRTVDSIHYKKAMLLFYEQNNLSAFKQIFIEQFAFAVKTYF